MLESISGYIKNIAFFLILSSFIGIILPGSKYKKYIDIVLGLILIIVMLEPLAGFIFGAARPFDKILNEITSSLSYDVKGLEYDPSTKEQMISEDFGRRIEPQLEAIIKTHDYYMEDFDFSLNIETGELLSLDISVSKKPPEPAKSKPVPFIRIEKVRINNGFRNSADDEAVSEAETTEINAIKKSVADFYNMLLDNIHIKVLMKN